MSLTHFNGFSRKTEGLFEMEIEQISEAEINTKITSKVTPHICPQCGQSTTHIKGYYERKFLLSVRLGGVREYATYNQRRYLCPACKKTFNETNPYVGKHQKMSQAVIMGIIAEAREIQSFSAIARRVGVSVPTIIRHFDHIGFPKPKTLPAVLSMDEFRGNAGGEKFQISLADPENKQLLDILPKKDTQSLFTYFLSYPKEVREQVQFIVMDMCPQFKKVVKIAFPKARIIADRFHIHRNVYWALENVRKREQNKFCNKAIGLKRNRKLLRKAVHLLTLQDTNRLALIFDASPDVALAYRLKMQFRYRKPPTNRDAIYRHLDWWIHEVERSGIPEFQRFRRSFVAWMDEIVNAYYYPYSNGFLEGTHNKIKTLKRTSFGVRNFARFRKRILLVTQKQTAPSPQKKIKLSAA